MDAIEIRPATPDDADAVADYHRRCFTNTYSSQLAAGELEAPDLEGTRQQLQEWFLPESELETRVAVVDGAPIGRFTIRGHQLVHLFVAPDHQGIGLGRHLLARGEAMIAARGHADFELHARVENLAAIAFYESAGWTMTGRWIQTVEHGISYDARPRRAPPVTVQFVRSGLVQFPLLPSSAGTEQVTIGGSGTRWISRKGAGERACQAPALAAWAAV